MKKKDIVNRIEYFENNVLKVEKRVYACESKLCNFANFLGLTYCDRCAGGGYLYLRDVHNHKVTCSQCDGLGYYKKED